jgi:hypothetical protein
MLNKNVGPLDRILRIVVGLAVLSLYFVLEGDQRWFALIGLVPLGTAFISFCPAYVLVGVNTCGGCCSGTKH